MDPNTHRNHFLINILCVLTLVTRKLQVICRRSTYRMTALLSGMSIVCVKAGCKMQNIYHSLFPISHFRVYSVLRHITWKLQVICGRSANRTTAILSETFFVWFRVAIEIWLESCGSRHASVVLWCDIVCVYCKPMYTLLFGTQLRLTTKLTDLMTAYYTPNDGLLPTMHRLHWTKLASYTTHCSVFSINRLHYY